MLRVSRGRLDVAGERRITFISSEIEIERVVDRCLLCLASAGNGGTPSPSYTTTRQESHHAKAAEELYWFSVNRTKGSAGKGSRNIRKIVNGFIALNSASAAGRLPAALTGPTPFSGPGQRTVAFQRSVTLSVFPSPAEVHVEVVPSERRRSQGTVSRRGWAVAGSSAG